MKRVRRPIGRRLAQTDGELAHSLRPILLKYFARKKTGGAEPVAGEGDPASASQARAKAKKKVRRQG